MDQLNAAREAIQDFTANNESFEPLIKEEILAAVDQWKYVDPQYSIIDTCYLTLMNSLFLDKEIQKLIEKEPEMKLLLTIRLLKHLLALHERISQLDFTAETAFIKQLRLMADQDFYLFLSEKHHRLRAKLRSFFGDQEYLCSSYKQKIKQQKRKNTSNHKKMKQAELAQQEEIKDLQKRIARANSALQDLEKPKPGLKILGKLDLKTGKWIQDNRPKEQAEKAQLQSLLADLKDKLSDKKAPLKHQQLQDDIQIAKHKIAQLQQRFCDLLESFLMKKKRAEENRFAQEEVNRCKKELKQMLLSLKEAQEQLNAIGLELPLHQLWGYEKGFFLDRGFHLLERYNRLIEQNKQLQEVVNLLGRQREQKKEFEEVTIQKEEQRGTLVLQDGRTEVVGVQQSNELHSLLSSELALLSTAETENLFYQKFAEKQLTSFQYQAEDYCTETHFYEERLLLPKESPKGPFILAVDTSGSMQGTPEEIAKLLAFAMSKIGLQDQRPVYLISFSVQIECLEISQFTRDLPRLVSFLQKSFHGGTDVAPALKAAIKQLEKDNFQKADVLLISDGDFAGLNASDLAEIKAMQAQGTQFNSLIVKGGYSNYAHSYSYPQLDFCDHIWSCRNDLSEILPLLQENLGKK